MPKKKHAHAFPKPNSPIHPSLSVRSRESDHPAARSLPPGVNERLCRLRAAQLQHLAVNRPLDTPSSHSIQHSAHEAYRTPEALPSRPRPGLRVYGGRRAPPGPRAPESWLVRRERGEKDLPNFQCDGMKATALPGYDFPAPSSLLDLSLQRLAGGWDFFAEYEQYYLPILPVRLKELLLRYIAVNNSHLLESQSLNNLFQDDTQLADATGADGLRRVDVSCSIGRSLQLKYLKHLFTARPQRAPVAIHSLEDSIPETWDSSSAVLTNPSISSVFHTVTHLSLASPGSAVTWSALLSLLPSIPQLTHLSLAYWPQPTISPNSTTAFVASPSGSIQYGGSSFYSAYDGNWNEAASLIRRVAKSALCLQWFDLTGCWPWVSCLHYASAGWVGMWGGLEIVKIGQGWVPDEFAWTNGQERELSLNDAQGTVEEKRLPLLQGWIDREMMADKIQSHVRLLILAAAKKAAHDEASLHGMTHSDDQQSEPAVRMGRPYSTELDDWSARAPKPAQEGPVNVRTRPITFERR